MFHGFVFDLKTCEKLKMMMTYHLFLNTCYSFFGDIFSYTTTFVHSPRYTPQLSRNQRFSASFHHTVETLVNMMMPHITQKYKDNLDAARNANHSLAVFIKVWSRR